MLADQPDGAPDGRHDAGRRSAERELADALAGIPDSSRPQGHVPGLTPAPASSDRI